MYLVVVLFIFMKMVAVTHILYHIMFFLIQNITVILSLSPSLDASSDYYAWTFCFYQIESTTRYVNQTFITETTGGSNRSTIVRYKLKTFYTEQ